VEEEDRTDPAGTGDGEERSLAMRITRSLKDVDRLVSKSPEVPPEQKALLRLEQAKVSALLALATAIRQSDSVDSSKK
jgi:hypothetical protein